MSRQIMDYRVRITISQMGLMLKSKFYIHLTLPIKLLLQMEHNNRSIESPVDIVQYFSIYLCHSPSNISNKGLYTILVHSGKYYFICTLINPSLSEKKTHQTQETKQHREIQQQFYAVIQSDYHLLRLLTVIQVRLDLK